MIVETLVQKTPWWNSSFKHLPKKSRVQFPVVFVESSLNLDPRGNLRIILRRFFWQPCTPPTSIFSISISAGIEKKSVFLFFKSPTLLVKISAGRDLAGKYRFLERDVFGRPKLSCRYAWSFQDVGWDRFHMWRSAENTNAVSEMFFWALFFVMRVVSTHDCMTLWHSYPFF